MPLEQSPNPLHFIFTYGPTFLWSRGVPRKRLPRNVFSGSESDLPKASHFTLVSPGNSVLKRSFRGTAYLFTPGTGPTRSLRRVCWMQALTLTETLCYLSLRRCVENQSAVSWSTPLSRENGQPATLNNPAGILSSLDQPVVVADQHTFAKGPSTVPDGAVCSNDKATLSGLPTSPINGSMFVTERFSIEHTQFPTDSWVPPALKQHSRSFSVWMLRIFNCLPLVFASFLHGGTIAAFFLRHSYSRADVTGLKGELLDSKVSRVLSL